MVDGVGEHSPQPGAGAVFDACPAPGRRHVLAGEPAAQDVDGRDFGPVDRGDVAEVGHAGPAVRQHLRCGFVDLAMPDGGAAEHLLDGHVQAARPGEQGSDSHSPYPVNP